jgi:hypothetical protein
MKMKEHGMELIQDNWENEIYIKTLEETVKRLKKRLTEGLDYEVLYDYSSKNGVSYDDLCVTMRSAMTATPTKEPTP